MTTPHSTESTLPFHVRQGDVLVLGVAEIPEEAKPIARDRGRVILACGEVTGHAHAIAARDATLLELDGERYLRVTAPVTLDHEEHATIELPPGAFRVVIQREYVPAELPEQAWRRVVD